MSRCLYTEACLIASGMLVAIVARLEGPRSLQYPRSSTASGLATAKQTARLLAAVERVEGRGHWVGEFSERAVGLMDRPSVRL